MAHYRAVLSVGESLVTYLRNAYPQELRDQFTCDFRLVSSNELNADDLDFGTADSTQCILNMRADKPFGTRHQNPRRHDVVGIIDADAA